ncbi:dnaJ homolog subfamily C member 27 [Octopus bimaculoides]|uniref:J domain-containing protein n=1 Tax=Octopus bimaculoides TaxID=37653 RepID=A0A0L8GRW3_OCTBM|nr:dnaJ homolog subfamily C member 27 [Octopus bimaculoides]|eukprot:XP_014778723.1 PREDICTED: dnaJ homolog subfamily C member 27-like [Octopus bimaculoides]
MENTSHNKPSRLRIKLITMGETEVGKSCVVKRYCERRFVHKYLTTIGIDYGVTKVQIKNRDVRLNIFDMAGHPMFYEVRNEFYRDAQGALLVFDLSRRCTFECLDQWLIEMKNEMTNTKDVNNMVVCVCGNKVDKRRVVNELEGRLWADSHGFHYFETSAQTGEGIIEMFNTLLGDIVATIENGGTKIPLDTQLGFTKDQVDLIHRLKNAKYDHEQLGVHPNAVKEDINKAYRRLAVLLHPDKNIAPGSEEAFKILVAARSSMLKRCL